MDRTEALRALSVVASREADPAIRAKARQAVQLLESESGAKIRCPFCGGMDIVDMEIQWAATSEQDPENGSTLNEHQCWSCDNRSFWI